MVSSPPEFVFSYTYGEEPDVVNVAHGLVTGQLDAPLAAVLVGRILPHGLDALLEQVVVGTDSQIAGLHDIVVDTMEILKGRVS